MKKTLILLVVASLGAATMTSCKKSNKSKMTGEWTVDSFEASGTNTNTNGDVTSWSDSNDGTTTTSSNTSAGVTTSSSMTETITYSVLKDGTWSSVTTTVETLPTVLGGVTLENEVVNRTENASGTWSFVKKNKSADVKTNERVVFNETASDYSESSVTTPTTEGTSVGLTSSTSSNSGTSADDDSYYGNTMMFLITESKKKTLTMTLDNSNASTGSTTNAGTTTTSSWSSTFSYTMTMTQE